MLRLLYEERGITACGHETADTGPWLPTPRDAYALMSCILNRNRNPIELLAKLDRFPQRAAWSRAVRRGLPATTLREQ